MKPSVTDALWERLEPLLPPCAPSVASALSWTQAAGLPQDPHLGILFVLKTGIAWADLPAELGCGCGKTCRGCISNAGTKPASGPSLHAVLLAELNAADPGSTGDGP